jgi:hypothetical protein
VRLLIASIAGVVLVSASAVAAQVQPSEKRSGDPCEQFKMRIVTPSADVDYKLRIYTPPAVVDYKMRIFNPCPESNLVVAADPPPIPGKPRGGFQFPPSAFGPESDLKIDQRPLPLIPPYRPKPQKQQ